MYTYGPGRPNIVEEEKIYWEKDDINPNYVNYDLEQNVITNTEEEMSGSLKSNKIKNNIVSRNVNSRRRKFNR
jgi:hypothetical protein